MLKVRLPRENISRVHHTMQSLLPWTFLLVLCPRSLSPDTTENVKAPKKTGKIREKTHRRDANVHYVATGVASA
ncbi:hypothetical protein V8E36_005283, partial [Tilletia maclaganii]